jgi:hypothetical protein
VSQETAGRRVFPDQLVLSEPFVEDELSFPSLLHIRTPFGGEQRQASVTTIDGEIKKRLTRDFEASISGGLTVLDQDDAALLAGFDNLELGIKYQFLRDQVREAVASAALTWEVGGTGRAASGAESFDTLRPAFLFAKGLGDLPAHMALLKPLALGGLLGADLPLRSTSKITTVEGGETRVRRLHHPHLIHWGLLIEYSLPYLDSLSPSPRIPAVLNQIVPIVELDFRTPVDGNARGRTTGTANAGAVWVGDGIQIGCEAVVPVSERSGKNVGVRAFFRFDLERVFGKWAGRPVFGGTE